MKVGLDVKIPLIRVLFAGGAGEKLPPPKKVFPEKNSNAISNVDLI